MSVMNTLKKSLQMFLFNLVFIKATLKEVIEK